MRFTFTLLFSLFYGLLISQDFFQQEYNLSIIGSAGPGTVFGGNGVSFVDWNDDGLDDLTFGTDGGEEVYFFENNGDGFTQISPPFVSNTLEHKQVLWIDYDNDGDKDIFITAYDGVNKLYRNDGLFNFVDVSVSTGISNIPKETFGATFGDINEDGYLDLYICNYGAVGTVGDENIMYIYNSTTNAYMDVTIQSNTGNGLRQSFCSAFFDFDRDGDLDIYISNDRNIHQNTLYMNLGGAVFVDVSVPSNTYHAIDAMNTAIGDFNKDGYFDIYVTNNSAQPAILYENNGNNTFSDVTVAAGVEFYRNGWTANWVDVDNDKDEDIYASTHDIGATKPSALFMNNDDGTFSETLFATNGLGGMDTLGAHNNAFGDFNNDGRPDFIVSRIGTENFSVYSNNYETGNNFFKLDLEGTVANKDGYGTIVEVWKNGSSRVFSTHSTHAFLAQNSDYINIGIGSDTSIDSLHLHWNCGPVIETIQGTDILINGMNEIVQGSGVTDSYTLNLCLPNHNIIVDPIPSQMYGAKIDLTSNTQIISGSNIQYRAELGGILLDQEFEVEAGAEFIAEIEECSNN